jgi:hypothetical protein
MQNSGDPKRRRERRHREPTRKVDPESDRDGYGAHGASPTEEPPAFGDEEVHHRKQPAEEGDEDREEAEAVRMAAAP